MPTKKDKPQRIVFFFYKANLETNVTLENRENKIDWAGLINGLLITDDHNCIMI